MSDYDSSVISDDISVASDGSVEYDPRAAMYDMDDNTSQLSSRGPSRHNSPRNSSRQTSPKHKSGSRNSVQSKPHLDIASVDGNEDDYSADFTDDFEPLSEADVTEEMSGSSLNLNLNNDKGQKLAGILKPSSVSTTGHDEYGSGAGIGQKATVKGQRGKLGKTSPGKSGSPRKVIDATSANTAANQHPPPLALPILTPGHQALQAEMMLDDISREVVSLRNQQRLALRERAVEAREKKSRAEQRRRDHEQRLQSAEANAREALRKSIKLEGENQQLVDQVSALTESKSQLERGLSSSEQDVVVTKQHVEVLNAQLKSSRAEMEDAHDEFSRRQREWLNQKAALEAETKKAELLQSVVQTTIDANEARLRKERETLPEYQARALQEQQTRLSSLEGSLKEREGAMRSQEEHKMSMIDNMRKDAREEALRFSKKVQADITQEKSDLERLSLKVRAEQAAWETTRAMERAELEAMRLSLRNSEKVLADGRADLDKRMAQFDGAQRMLQPTLDAVERDRADAAALKAQADKVLLAAEEHSSSILAAERGLIRREQSVSKEEARITQERNLHDQHKRSLAVSQARLRQRSQQIEGERFKLHQGSMDLANQVAVVSRESRVYLKESKNGFNVSEKSLDSISGSEVLLLKDQAAGYDENAQPNGSRDSDQRALGGVTAALERIMLATSAADDFDRGEASTFANINVDLPPPPVHRSTALQAVTERLSLVSPIAQSHDSISHTFDFSGAVQEVAGTAANMNAVASRYGIYAKR